MKVAVVLTLCVLYAFPVLAFGPKDALAYRSAENAAAVAALDAAAVQRQATAQGASGDVSTGARQNSKQTYSLSLQYLRDPYTLAQADQGLDSAGRQVAQTTRDDVKRALLAHAGLWQAQANVEAARQREQATNLLLTEAVRKNKLGALSALDLESAQLDEADAKLSLQTATDALTSAQADAKRYGFQGDAEGATLHFALPAQAVEDAPAFRDATWTMTLAEARETKAKDDLKPGLSFNANFIGREQFAATVSSRGPSANVTLGYPSLFNPQFLLYGAGWTFALTADVPINPATKATRQSAAADAALAAARLERQRADLEVQAPQAQRAATAAETTLENARQRVTLAQRRVDVAVARQQAGAASDVDVLNAKATLGDAQAKLAGAWKDYVTAVAAYLDLTGEPWAADGQVGSGQ